MNPCELPVRERTFSYKTNNTIGSNNSIQAI